MKKEIKIKRISIFQIFLLIFIFILFTFIFFDIEFKSFQTKKPTTPIGQKLLKKANKIERKVEEELETDIAQKIEEDIYEQEKLGKEVETIDYQLKNANEEIALLKNELENLKKKIEYKNINKHQLTIAYLLIDIQNKINNEKSFKSELDQLEILANNNIFIIEKINELTPYSIKKIPTEKKIVATFRKEMDLALQTTFIKSEKGIKNKIKNIFYKLITIRKINDSYSSFKEDSIDLWLSKIEQSLERKDYVQALNVIQNNTNYSKHLIATQGFLKDFLTINKLVEELIEYNKNTNME